MRTRAIAAVAAAIALAAPAATAQAESLVFVKDGNVWLANPDGTGQYQVTSDGTADNPWRSPSQADDGTIVAVREHPNAGPLFRMKQNGELIGTIEVPPPAGAGPLHPHVSPDGKLVAYEGVFSRNTCNQYGCYIETSSDVAYTRTDRYTPVDEYGYVGRGAGHPSWIDSGRAMVGLNNVVSTDGVDGDPVEWWFDLDHSGWFPNGETVEDGEYANGRLVVPRGQENGNSLQFYRSDPGDFAGDPTPTCTLTGPSNGPNGQRFFDPTLSPDGGRVAWQEGDGIWTATVPADGTACDQIEFALTIPGASEPDWGPADVNPGPRRQAEVKANTPVAPPVKVDPPRHDDPRVERPAAPLTLTVRKARLRAAVRKGLVLTVTTGAAGRVDAVASAGRKRVGKGSAAASPAGATRVKVKLAKALRKRRSVKLTIAATFTPQGGAPRTGSAVVTVKR